MRRHLTIPLTGPPAARLEGLRRTWDPAMAAVVPAHVTLVYPEEALLSPARPLAPRQEGEGALEKERENIQEEGTPHREMRTTVRTLDPVRVERLMAQTAPFRLRLGPVITLDEGRGGVFVAIQDVDGTWAHLRHRLLAPYTSEAPDRAAGFPAHATIVHPRTSNRGPECWRACRGIALTGEFTISTIVHTLTTAETFTVDRRFALGEGPLRRRERPPS